MLFARHYLPGSHKAFERGTVVTIGAYDGVHVGHQAILSRVIAVAAERNLTSVLMSFEPTPKEFFSRETAPARLTRFREKYVVLRELGLDVFFCPRFDRAMAAIEPDAFARNLLVDRLGARHVVVGDDFRYAHKRSGSFETLQAAGRRMGFEVERVGSVVLDGQRASSTAIREALRLGDFELAGKILGRPYRMSGRVIEGKRLGRTLGFPTANIAIHRRESPVQGVFAVRLSGIDDEVYAGVASVGTRPTVDDGEVLLEVHIFDFDRRIYGAHVDVEFVQRLRAEEYFPDLVSLTRQMQRDAEKARRILARKS